MTKLKKWHIRFFAGCVIIIGFFTITWSINRISQEELPDIPEVQSSVEMTLNELHQVATRNGKKEWFLDAKSAQLLQGRGQLLLTKPVLVFLLKNGERLQLTALTGILDTATSDINITGNVVAKLPEYQMSGDEFLYQHEQRILSTDSEVQIFGKAFRLSADTLIYDLNSQQAIFNGQVEGLFFDSFL